MSSPEGEGGEVGSEGLVELSCDVVFQTSDDFFLGASLGESSLHVCLGVGVAARPVHLGHHCVVAVRNGACIR